MKFQEVLGFYDVSRLFICVHNCCTAAGHNYGISADLVRVVLCVPFTFSWKKQGCVCVGLSRSKEGVSYIRACRSACVCFSVWMCVVTPSNPWEARRLFSPC